MQRVLIDSNPQGAGVFVNRDYQGKTPVLIKDRPWVRQNYAVVVAKEGYQVVEKTLTQNGWDWGCISCNFFCGNFLSSFCLAGNFCLLGNYCSRTLDPYYHFALEKQEHPYNERDQFLVSYEEDPDIGWFPPAQKPVEKENK